MYEHEHFQLPKSWLEFTCSLLTKFILAVQLNSRAVRKVIALGSISIQRRKTGISRSQAGKLLLWRVLLFSID